MKPYSQSEYGNILTRKTLYLDTFQVVSVKDDREKQWKYDQMDVQCWTRE